MPQQTRGIGDRRSAARGFTLMELAVTILIMGIALAVGVVRLGSLSVLRSEGQSTARRLVADLRLTQSEAITKVKNHYILFTDGGTKYTQYAIYRVEAGANVAARKMVVVD